IGCEGQNSSNITVFDLPIVDAGDNDTICFGETGLLEGSGSTGDYLWTVTGETLLSTSHAPASTTVYYLIITDMNNCVASDSAYIVVNPLPLVDAGSNDTICFGKTGSLLASGTGDFLWNTGETTADISDSPSVTTPYTVVVTDANGCTASDITNIVVNQLPIVSAGGDKGLCDGDSVTLTATGGIDYLWNTGDIIASITIAPDTFSVFSVFVTDINGCVNEDSTGITVYLNPVVGIVGLDSAYCPNADDVILSGTPS